MFSFYILQLENQRAMEPKIKESGDKFPESENKKNMDLLSTTKTSYENSKSIDTNPNSKTMEFESCSL